MRSVSDVRLDMDNSRFSPHARNPKCPLSDAVEARTSAAGPTSNLIFTGAQVLVGTGKLVDVLSDPR